MKKCRGCEYFESYASEYDDPEEPDYLGLCYYDRDTNQPKPWSYEQRSIDEEDNDECVKGLIK
jgi:hypothetical protein